MVLNPVSGDGAILVDVKWDYVPWLWKGGCAMELRIRTARTTRDVDLALRPPPSGPAEWSAETATVILPQAAAINLDDGLEFAIVPQPLTLRPLLPAAHVFRWTRKWPAAASRNSMWMSVLAMFSVSLTRFLMAGIGLDLPD